MSGGSCEDPIVWVFVAGSLSSGVGGLESKLGDEILGERIPEKTRISCGEMGKSYRRPSRELSNAYLARPSYSLLAQVTIHHSSSILSRGLHNAKRVPNFSFSAGVSLPKAGFGLGARVLAI